MARGFGITVEDEYGEETEIENIDVDWFQKMNEVNFALGDEAETDDGGSRTAEVVWAGAAGPKGSTSGTVDLQRITYYLFGFLDHYMHALDANDMSVHEFWGGENHELPSFTGLALYDDLKIALYGLLMDGLKLEVSDGAMTANVDWLYATETYELLNSDFEEPEELVNSKIPIRFYDVQILLDGEKPGTVQTSFNFEGNNNHDQEGTVGLGSRFPQERAQASKRNVNLSLATTLNRRSYQYIMDARYGKKDSKKPDNCRVLTVPLELRIIQCEHPDNQLIIKFPNVTLNAEFDLKGADRIEATLNMQALGTGEVTLNDGETVVKTDIYAKLVNNVPELGAESPIVEENPETFDLSISVRDSELQPVEGAVVSISNTEISSTTGSAGGCTLTNVPAGSQTIVVTAQGYETYTDTIVVSAINNEISIELTEE